MRILVLRRKREQRYAALAVPALSLALGLLIYAAILCALGASLLGTLASVAGAFASPAVIKDLLVLSILGYALLVPFRASIWNIGGEGQFYVAMLPGILLTLFVFNPEGGTQVPPAVVLLLSVAGGAALAAAWAALAGAIRAHLQIDEVPVTIIMNYIAYYLINYLVWGPLRGRRTYGYLRTDEVPEVYRMNVRLPPLSADNPALALLLPFVRQVAYYLALLLGAISAAAFVWWFFKYTKLGLYVRVMGSNPRYLQASGVSVRSLIVIVMVISGALIGFAGSLYLFTELGRLPYELERQTAGYGYLAVLVAWLSSLDPRLVPLSAYVVAVLRNAGIAVQLAGLGGVEQTLMLIGSVLLVYSLSRFLIEYEVRIQP